MCVNGLLMPAMGALHGLEPKARQFPPPSTHTNSQLKSILNLLLSLGQEFSPFKKVEKFPSKYAFALMYVPFLVL